MGYTDIPSTNQALIGTYGQFYNRSSSSFSGIFNFSTYPNRALSSLNMRYVVGGRCLYLNIASSNPTKGSVSITYPWSETSITTSTIGNNRQVLTQIYGYMDIRCNVNYGYSFKGWYTLPSSGTLITTQNLYSVFTSDYQGVWYAQFN
jgi:hypothetical protein